jgi:GrpB-like predicted nucleotidyltransferase (UPF0157 family)
MGWIDRGDGGENGGYLWVKEIAHEVRAFHLHVLAETDRQIGDYLEFRRKLVEDPVGRARYEALEISLHSKLTNDRGAYPAGKAVLSEPF